MPCACGARACKGRACKDSERKVEDTVVEPGALVDTGRRESALQCLLGLGPSEGRGDGSQSRGLLGLGLRGGRLIGFRSKCLVLKTSALGIG